MISIKPTLPLRHDPDIVPSKLCGTLGNSNFQALSLLGIFKKSENVKFFTYRVKPALGSADCLFDWLLVTMPHHHLYTGLYAS